MDQGDRSFVRTTSGNFHPSLRSRQLQLDTGCASTFGALNTTYNSDSRVPPYVGIMFEVVPRRDVEVLTFELDLIDSVTADDDLSVEIYARRGGFSLSVNDPNEWELLSETAAILDPFEGRGALVPTQDMRPVKLLANDRWSFYITMQLPVLDHRVYALTKTGEIYLRTSDMDFYVGGGLTEYKFPAAIDNLVDPQFAGVLHYKTESCDEPQPITTRVEYLFLMDLNPTYEDIASIGNYVNEAMDMLALDNNFALPQLGREYDLVKSGLPLTEQVTASVTCPPTWLTCPFGYIRSSVFYLHSPDISPERVEYELRLVTKYVTDRVRSRFERTNNVEYIGLESISAKYSFTLTGVPRQQAMDEVQQQYFADVTRNFLSNSLSNNLSVDVLELIVDDTVSVADSERRLQQVSSVQLSGRILGVYRPPLEEGIFASLILDTVKNRHKDLIERLKYERFRPGEINTDNRYAYFDDIENVNGIVEVDDAAFFGFSDDVVSSDIFLYVGIALGAVAFLCLSVFGVKRFRMYRKYRQEVEEYRERMRQERRVERQEQKRKKNSMLTSQRPPSSYKETDSDATPADSEARVDSDGSPDRTTDAPIVVDTVVEGKDGTISGRLSVLGPMSNSIASLPPTTDSEGTIGAAVVTESETRLTLASDGAPMESALTAKKTAVIEDYSALRGAAHLMNEDSMCFSDSSQSCPSNEAAWNEATRPALLPDAINPANAGIVENSIEKFNSSAESSERLQGSVDSFASLDLSGDESFAAFVAAKKVAQKSVEDEDSSSSSSGSSSSGSSSSSASSSSDDDDGGVNNEDKNTSFGSLEGKLLKYVGRSVSKGGNEDSNRSFGDASSCMDDSSRGFRRGDDESTIDMSTASYRNIAESSPTDQPRQPSLEGFMKHQERIEKTTPAGGQSLEHRLDEGQSLGNRSDEGPRRTPTVRGRARDRRGSLRSMSSMESIKKAASVMSGSRSPTPNSRERSVASRTHEGDITGSMFADIDTPSVIRVQPQDSFFADKEQRMASPNITRGMWQLSPGERPSSRSLSAMSDPLGSPSGSPNPGSRIMHRTTSNRSVGLPFVGANPNARPPFDDNSHSGGVSLPGLEVAPATPESERRLSTSSSSGRSGEITPFVGAKPKLQRSPIAIDTEGPRRQSMPLTTMRDDEREADLRDQFNRSLSYQGPWTFYTSSSLDDYKSEMTPPLVASPSLSPRSQERPPTPPLGTPNTESPRSPFMPVPNQSASQSPREAARSVHRSKSDDLYFLRGNPHPLNKPTPERSSPYKGRFSTLLDAIASPLSVPIVSKPRGRARESHRSRSMDLSYTDIDTDVPLAPLPSTLQFPYGKRHSLDDGDEEGLLSFERPPTPPMGDGFLGAVSFSSPGNSNVAPAIMPPSSGVGVDGDNSIRLLQKGWESGHSSYAADEDLLMRSRSLSRSGHSSTFSATSTEDEADSANQRRLSYRSNKSRSLHTLGDCPPKTKIRTSSMDGSQTFMSPGGGAGSEGSYHGGFSRLLDDLLKESYPNGVPGSAPR